MIDTSKTYKSKTCGSFRVVNYVDSQNVIVEFIETKFTVTVKAKHITDGQIKDLFHPVVYGNGFLGSGKHLRICNGKISTKYKCWTSMLQRCYDDKYLKIRPTYKGCSVCDSWLNYQNFGDWFDKYFVEGWQLDKDILFKGNKLYSPLTCCFVLSEINNLFTKTDKLRGCLPIGVCFDKQKKNYKSSIKINGKDKRLGNYDTIGMAFNAYKTAKEDNIKRLANKYINELQPNTYISLISYDVNSKD